ncbi:MAG: prepilin peptidase [Chloroflexi bacterium]|nr:prepilin peptidase [Chloroflexota bacterium]
MFLLVALAGWLGGWLLCIASDYLPRFSASFPASSHPDWAHPPAIWRLLKTDAQRPPAGLWLQIAVEFLSAVATAVLWLRFGWSLELLLYILGLSFFMLIALIDLKYRLVLNIFTYPAIIMVFIAHGLTNPDSLVAIALGGALAFSMFFLTAWLKPGELGGGDVKLATVIGVTFGFPQVLWALMIGAGAGGIMTMGLLLSQRGTLKTRIPYAPFLCLGAVVALFYNPLLVTI